MSEKRHVSIRTVTGSNGRPQLYLSKELKILGFEVGDTVAVIVEDDCIMIKKAKLSVEV